MITDAHFSLTFHIAGFKVLLSMQMLALGKLCALPCLDFAGEYDQSEQ